MSPQLLILTIALGSLGAILRYITQMLWTQGAHRYGAVLAVNLVGSALAGGLMAFPENPLTLPLVAGLCAGLTTFSTFVVQLLPTPNSPAPSHRVALGLLHVVGSVGACILAFEGVSLIAA
jgi:CrcB protein